MTPLCNDILTRIGAPQRGRKQQYFVGEKGTKNGMPYTVKAFGISLRREWNAGELVYKLPNAIWLLVKFKGDKAHKWDMLMIGNSNQFVEKLVMGGRHTNPVFDCYWPKDWPQPV